MEFDQIEWSQPKDAALWEFKEEVSKWIAKVLMLSTFHCVYKVETVKNQKAELLAWASSLAQKQVLEKEEAILTVKKEQPQLEPDITANTAKLSIMKGNEDAHVVMFPADWMNENWKKKH